ncbi:MAG: cell wall-associated protein wapA, partial [Bdellovibrionota bacterium]
VKVKGADSKQISSSKYEYFLKHKPDGEEWTFRLITTLDGDTTETTYNECCGLPVAIKHGSQETTFSYDAKGHVTKKTTPNEVTELEYDSKVGKVTKVRKFSKTDKRKNSWSEFKYDPKGNLIFAKNSEGRGVQLIYDTNGRIKSLVDQNRRQINFKYNENSKPIEITDPALGTITVSYTNSGEIKKVDSTAGRKIALQVTSAFQNLLDIIRPAGLSISF